MRILSFVTAMCMAAVATIASAKDTPSIPCTFSCEYSEEMTYRLSSAKGKKHSTPRHFSEYSNIALGGENPSNFGDYKYEFNWYHVEGKRMNQDGITPQTDNTSVIWEYPNIVTVMSPFFDRYTCATYPNAYVRGKCPSFNEEAKYYSTDRCPYNTSAQCDLFIYMSPDYSTAMNGYFHTDTNIPDAVIIETEYYSIVEIFRNFVAEEPDESHFRAPDNVQCTVLLDDDDTTNNNNNDDFINSPDNIKRIRASAKTWKAGYSKAFEGMTRTEMKSKLFPVFQERKRENAISAGYTRNRFIGANFGDVIIPDEYDARERYESCNIETIRDQGSCGSCWAFGAVEALEDRMCIHGGGNASIVLSPQYLVSCDKNNAGCSGGYLDQAWYGLRDVGTVTEECFAYRGTSASCPTYCEDKSVMKKYKSVDAYSVFVPFEYEKNMRLIQEEIYKNGPVEAAYMIYYININNVI